MRSGWDALRSLKRYVALALGGDWEVAFVEDVGEFSFPMAVIEQVGPELSSGPAFVQDVTGVFHVTAWSKRALTEADAKVTAYGVKDTLWQAFLIGGIDGSRPRRVPLYNYDGATLVEPADGRGAHDYLRVTEASFDILPDDAEPLIQRVVGDLRLTWRRGTRVAGGNLVQSVEADISVLS